MTSARRQRDAIAPSLFPFLAVLLCTMGALVVILMLVVASAQASAKQVAKQRTEQIEEVESQIKFARQAYEKEYLEGQIDLEKSRLALQHLENHVQELLEELDDLQTTKQLLTSDSQQDQTAEIEESISELEKQLADAKEELTKKLENPDGDKPIFAIIPYDGPNGTHRRPIYLECTGRGLLIQPEGIPLGASDLQPPFGPGNPLDAALRTIRTEFAPENRAVTSTAYPLLIVRPSGIAVYLAARAAMSGWDDQFGYELVDENTELIFPETKPGLKPKVAKALDLARQRQAALVMAMPRKYGRLGENNGTSVYRGPSASTASYNSLSGPNSLGTAVPGSDFSNTQSSRSNTSNGTRGGFSDLASNDNYLNSEPNLSENLGFSRDRSNSDSRNSAGQQFDGTPLLSEQGDSRAFGGGSNGSESGNFGAGGQGSGQSSAASRGTKSSGANGVAGGSSSIEAAQPASASGNQISIPTFGLSQNTGSSSQQSLTTSSTGSPSPSSANRSGSSSQNQVNSQQSQQNVRASEQGLNGQSGAATRSVANSRGRNWAWSEGPRTQTPVVRSIRLVCANDHWLILPDAGKKSGEVRIEFDGSPRERAERLAKLIHSRVESWGLALSGGYWKPILVAEVQPGADWRYDQLLRLLEHSGLEVRRRIAR